MRNIVYQAIILGMVALLTTGEYTGSSGSSSSSSSGSDGYSKSGFISSYNGGYVGEYAGQLGAGKAIGELQSYRESQIAPEHGSQYDDGESRFSDSYGQQNDGGRKYSNSQFDGYSQNLDLTKFPVDVEAHRYTGGGSSDIGLGEDEDHQQDQHRYGGHQDYQSDDDGDQTAKKHNTAYNPYDEPQKPLSYKGYTDHVSMQIVPYSGYEEAEANGEHYSKYGNQHSYNQAYDEPEAPSPSYSPSYESPKSPSSSYSVSSYESPKSPSSSYSASSYESPKAPSSSYSASAYESPKSQSSSYSASSYESPKAPSSSYSASSYESPKAPSSSYSDSSYESPKVPTSSYSSSYDSPKKPSPTYSSLYESTKTASPVPEHDYSSGSSGSYSSLGGKYQHSSGPASESPSKSLDTIQKIKSSGLKNFHTSLQKNIMTIDHGKGSFSYSSLYSS